MGRVAAGLVAFLRLGSCCLEGASTVKKAWAYVPVDGVLHSSGKNDEWEIDSRIAAPSAALLTNNEHGSGLGRGIGWMWLLLAMGVAFDLQLKPQGKNNWGLFGLMLNASRLVEIAVGGTHACGLYDAHGDVFCWRGLDSPADGGNFSAISVGSEFACGIAPEKGYVCFLGRVRTSARVAMAARLSPFSFDQQTS